MRVRTALTGIPARAVCPSRLARGDQACNEGEHHVEAVFQQEETVRHVGEQKHSAFWSASPGPTVPFRCHHRPALNRSARLTQTPDQTAASLTPTLCALQPTKTNKSSARMTSTNAMNVPQGRSGSSRVCARQGKRPIQRVMNTVWRARCLSPARAAMIL